jgi:hypothetical protein
MISNLRIDSHLSCDGSDKTISINVLGSHTHKYLRTSCRAPTRSVSSIRTDILGGPSSSLLLVTVAIVAPSTPAMAAAANRRMAVVVVVLWMMGFGNGMGRRRPTQAPTLTPTPTPRPATAVAALVVVAVVAVRTRTDGRSDRIAIMFNAIYWGRRGLLLSQLLLFVSCVADSILFRTGRVRVGIGRTIK